MKKNLWKRGGALLLLGSMMVGMAGCAGSNENGPISGQKNSENALVVYAAEYPKMHPYPENNGFDFDEERSCGCSQRDSLKQGCYEGH